MQKSEQLTEELERDEKRRKEKEEDELWKRSISKRDEVVIHGQKPEHETQVQLLLRRVDYYTEQEQFDDAKKYVEELLHLTENNPHVLHKLGIIHIKQNRFSDAETLYRDLTKLKLDAMHFVNLGQCLLSQSKLDEALDAYLYALEMNREYAHTFMQAGFIYEQLGKFTEAKEMYYGALEIEPDNIDLHTHLIELEEASGNIVEAEYLKKNAAPTN